MYKPTSEKLLTCTNQLAEIYAPLNNALNRLTVIRVREHGNGSEPAGTRRNERSNGQTNVATHDRKTISNERISQK